MQASALTQNQARALGSSDIRLAVAMTLDLATLSTIDKFEFQSYNENLSEATGLALKSVQNCMTQAKKLVSQHHTYFEKLVMDYALSDAALTRGMQHVYAMLQAGSYGRSLPELAACLSGKASPMLKARADRAEAAAIANKAMLDAANKPAPELVPPADTPSETPAVPNLGTVADTSEAPADADAPAPADAPADADAVTDTSEAPAVPNLGTDEKEWVSIEGVDTVRCAVHDNATYDDIMSMVETLLSLAQNRQPVVVPEAKPKRNRKPKAQAQALAA